MGFFEFYRFLLPVKICFTNLFIYLFLYEYYYFYPKTFNAVLVNRGYRIVEWETTLVSSITVLPNRVNYLRYESKRTQRRGNKKNNHTKLARNFFSSARLAKLSCFFHKKKKKKLDKLIMKSRRDIKNKKLCKIKVIIFERLFFVRLRKYGNKKNIKQVSVSSSVSKISRLFKV